MKRQPTRRFNFTEAKLDSLSPAAEAVKMYDARVRDLGLKVLPSGKKQFFWFRSVPFEEQPERAGRPLWKTLGEYPDYPLADARAKVESLNSTLAKWKADGCPSPSPFVSERRDEMTLKELAEDYFARHLRAKANHPDEAEREIRYRLETHLKDWKTRSLSTIKEHHVRELHLRVGEGSGHSEANAVRENLSRLFNHAIKNKLWLGVNPTTNISRYKEKKRKRFVRRDEMPRLFKALKAKENKTLADYVNLALWTGARKQDVLSMRWQDLSLDDNRWTVPFPKGGESYEVALTREAVDILKNRRKNNKSIWVFPSFGKTGHLMDMKRSWNSMLKDAGIEDLRQHDLRRTLGSWQAAQGTSLEIIGKSLGHRSAAATRIYAQLDLDPVRQSVNAATRAILAASKKKIPPANLRKSKKQLPISALESRS